MKSRARKKQQSKTIAKGKAKSVKPAKIFLYALGVAAVGGGAYLVYDRVVSRKLSLAAQLPDAMPNSNVISQSSTSAYVPARSASANSDKFPLKPGSSGLRVGKLQRALESIIGASAMKANGGVDGRFGIGTVNALKIAGYGGVVDESTFNKIVNAVGSNGQASINAKDFAGRLHSAAQAKQVGTALSLLQQLKSVSDYSTVNEFYKRNDFISKTIVTDLLDYAFARDEQAKEQIRNEFLRIGLKLDDAGRWSLQGLRLYKDVITMRETFVTDPRGIRIAVDRNTVLGDEVQTANGMTWFRSVDNAVLTVPTQDVKYT